MPSKIMKTAQTSADIIKEKSENSTSPVELIDRFIVISPAFFEEVIQQKLERIDTHIMREDKVRYLDQPEDRWSHLCSEDDYFAEIFITGSTGERLVYFKAQGKLFSCNDIIEAAKIIEELRALEDLKTI